MTLPEQGFRFCGNAATKQGKWIHPAEMRFHAEWVDLTDVSDDDLAAFFS